MTKMQRVRTIIIAALTILAALVMIKEPSLGFSLAVLLLGIGLFVSGVRSLVYYVSMARHMVGGRAALYRGIIMIDIALFSLSVADVPVVYIMLYLLGLHLFAGAVGVLRALEAKRTGSKRWKLRLAHGAIDLVIAVLCLAFIGSVQMAAIIYAAGLVFSAAGQLHTAMRKTAIVYIQ